MADGDYERRAAPAGLDAREFERVRRRLAELKKAREAAGPSPREGGNGK